MTLTPTDIDHNPNVGDVSVSSRWQGAGLLQTINTLRSEELAEIRYALGTVLHRQFIAAVGQGFSGIVLCDPFCAGKTGDAFAANNGSSKYVRAGYVPLLNEDSNDRLETFVAKFNHFRDEKPIHLPGEVLIGVSRGEDGYTAFVSPLDSNERKGESITTLLPFDILPEDQEAARELVSIGALLNTGLWLAKRSGDYSLIEEMHGCLQPIQPTFDVNMEMAVLVRRITRQAYTELTAAVGTLPPMIVGESFTFGKLASLFNATDNGNLVFGYGWYDALYKVAVGVPNEMVTEDTIAEPPTVIAGARGLAEHFGRGDCITIATSGWANFWKEGEPDFFSIAVHTQVAGHTQTISVRIEVPLTAHEPLQTGRREVTRELGVTASVALLAESLEPLYPEAKDALAKVQSEMRSLIDSFQQEGRHS